MFWEEGISPPLPGARNVAVVPVAAQRRAFVAALHQRHGSRGLRSVLYLERSGGGATGERCLSERGPCRCSLVRTLHEWGQ